MKKLILVTLVSLLGACSNLSHHNISGTYKGTLPCADCQKIEAELTLNSDNTYQYDTLYFKRNKTYPFSEKGTFNVDKTAQNLIYLTHSGNLAVKIHPNFVEFVDENGNSIQGKNQYRLDKVNQ